MPELWRLTRNRYGRTAYDALARMGLTATVMTEYVATLEQATFDTADAGAFSVEVCEPGQVAPLDAPVDELRPDERVIAALEDGRLRGYCFCSVDAAHEIHPLERTLAFDGAYIRRVFVDRDHRNRGIATAIVAEACRQARERGVRRATALVALDNSPSRRLFERHGFEPRRRRRYVRAGPLTHRATRAL
ncbi:GNAT family N-acetyltransferase [Natrinema sp. 1APR25-10V2]|uniref:GNAT family N-acetyltransferase n=1 Tax=Natrinema sp. 1APR25-10V2 TaxID=2951081 RepID=UPI0028771F8F|nr:GNAT family N-acetyltransferase [Natrinema sp. 1APR25-10V2]MDS0475206.1 GNAT family N-acetyltransferase [Natrinema sp. 1APR25-10V2]